MTTRQRLMAVPLCIFIVGIDATSAMADEPVFFSFHRNFAKDIGEDPPFPASGTTLRYTFSPSPGQGCPDTTIQGPKGYWTLDAWDAMDYYHQPFAFKMRKQNAPWGSAPTWDDAGSTHPAYEDCENASPYPEQLAYAFAAQYGAGLEINYVLGDLELAHFSSSDLDDALGHIQDICGLGTYSGDVTGNPDGMGDIDVPQSTIQSWGIYFGNYRMHRYHKATSTEFGGAYEDIYIDLTSFQEPSGTDWKPEFWHDMFLEHNLNVLMPVAKVYDRDVLHSKSHWSGTAPTVRAGYMWAATERLSAAHREELRYGSMTGKKLIPWVCPFEPGSTNPQSGPYEDCWMPPPADFLALIKHMRLRGADGFFYWGGGFLDPGGTADTDYWSLVDEFDEPLNPWYYENVEWDDGAPPDGHEWWETYAIVSWEELDGEFDDAAIPYRLKTDKESGVIVSAMNDIGRLHILVSYMMNTSGHSPDDVDIDSYFPEAREYTGMSPNQYLSVNSYSHTYTNIFFTPDIDGDGDADCDDVDLYLALWTAEDPLADWNQDSTVDNDDLVHFATAWNVMSGGMWCQ